MNHFSAPVLLLALVAMLAGAVVGNALRAAAAAGGVQDSVYMMAGAGQ